MARVARVGPGGVRWAAAVHARRKAAQEREATHHCMGEADCEPAILRRAHPGPHHHGGFLQGRSACGELDAGPGAIQNRRRGLKRYCNGGHYERHFGSELDVSLLPVGRGRFNHIQYK